MNPNFKEGLTYLDWPKRRAIVHYRSEGIMVVRLVFNFKEGVPDELDEALKFFMRFRSQEEEDEYLKAKRKEVWDKLCKSRQKLI
ncbi:hypothetical protein QOZ98_000492 [Planomicrobium stackebrandtii]|uniref:Uncharacterized protein n=1 Tax=Planomicrobium stackebrandtii TaxID=253160 RepID=A0ABU0GQN4_9BACL|nr:hypothetical protein [Planomicrobium stackebrandtii]MDQ0427667.1 hypothetical protein [Planomicrobium stackebrandtii]